MKRSPLARKTPMRRVRATPRTHKLVVRLTGFDLAVLRAECWARDKMRCQDCGIRTFTVARFDGDPEAYEMAHVRNKRMYGDTLENVRVLCSKCHRKEHGGC